MVADQGLYVHYSVLDPLYWSIVDIVDSILTEHGDPPSVRDELAA